MSKFAERQAERLVLLIDDDSFSARFFQRRVAACSDEADRLEIEWVDSAEAGIARLYNQEACVPDLIIIDLKSSSRANLEFLAAFAAELSGKAAKPVVFTGHLTTDETDALLDAGAGGVFVRHADLHALDEEIRRVLSLLGNTRDAA